ncbi:hypothetical protein [Tropicimonas aquimaris]|uniref:Uncharacterized protein n=1 Tax=Tropicimonas aquimaris TaxID=914152 RepID=A0ABW3IUR5_9RHOB
MKVKFVVPGFFVDTWRQLAGRSDGCEMAEDLGVGDEDEQVVGVIRRVLSPSQ